MQTANETLLRNYDRLMLECAPVGIALFEARTLRLLSANPSYQALFEPACQPGQVIGRNLRDLLPEAVQAEIVALFEHVIQTRVPSQTCAYHTVSPTGGVRYWNWTLSPIWEEGQVRFVHVTITEVTSTILAQQEAERERQRLLDLETILLRLRQIPEPKRLAQAMLEALDTCFSPERGAIYGRPSEAGSFTLLATHSHGGRSADPSPFPATLAAGEHAEVLQAIQRRTPLLMRRASERHGKSQQQQWFLPETQCVIALPLWGNRCEGVVILALRTETGAEEVLATLRACAPHLAEALASTYLQAALAHERHRLHTILDQLPEGVVLVEARTSKISYANAAAAHLLGFGLPQLVGTPLNQSALLSPYGRSRHAQKSIFRWNFALIDALWGKTRKSQELVISRPDGTEVVVLSSAAPLRWSHGLITEAVIVFQDITAIKQLERQKETFFAVANHELRTPLTIITGFAELLQVQGAQKENAMSEYALSSIQKECEHVLHLIQDLLDVSRVDQASLEVQPKAQDLLTPLRQSIAKQMQTIRTHQFHCLVHDLAPEERLVGEVDLPRIEQVVRNLISNAVKYSPAGSTIEVGMRPQRDQEGTAHEVLVWVADQGIGIAPEDLPHIFERFYRADNGNRYASGFGVGLYLTKQLVHAHGGRIWVESSVGKGSTFYVALPLKSDRAAVGEEGSGQA